MSVYRITTEDGEFDVTLDDRETPSGGFLSKAEAVELPPRIAGTPPNILNVPGSMRPTSVPVSSSMVEGNITPQDKGPGFVDKYGRVISNLARPALEIGGAVGGGVLGAGATSLTVAGVPAGAAAGGALGYATGKQAADQLDILLGLKDTPKNAKENFIGSAEALKEGIQNEIVGLGVGKLVRGIANVPKSKIGQRATSAVFGPKADAIAARMERPEAIREAKTFSEISDEIPKSLNELREKISIADNDAWKTLRDSNDPADGAIPKDKIIALLKNVKQEIQVRGGGAVGQAQKNAIKMIDAIALDVLSVGKGRRGNLKSAMGVSSNVPKSNFVSESQMKDIIQSLRSNINYADQTAETTNNALKAAAARIDSVLKTQNPGYAEQMKPVAEMTDLFEQAKNYFGIKTKTNVGLMRTDSTVSKIKTIPTEKKDVSRKVLDSLGKKTGRNYIQDVEDARIAEQFTKGYTQGSRRVNPGIFAGASLGATIANLFGGGPFASGLGAGVGGLTGAMTGAYIDEQGGPIVAKLIDAYLKRTAGQSPVTAASPMLRAILAAQRVKYAN